jgi:5'-nucleotidase
MLPGMAPWSRPLRLTALVLALVAAACSAPPSTSSTTVEPAVPHKPAKAERLLTITVVGTNDIHGATNRLPALGGYVEVLRRLRSEQGGGVVVVDAGDMFQGTLESNMGEGQAIVELMNAIGFDASCVGNHEFDFGPVGKRATPIGPGDDPRGALKARAAQASYPFLAANVFESKSDKRIDWPNMPATKVVEVSGVKIGIIGLATVETPQTTLGANVSDLSFKPLVETVVRESKALRQQGVTVVIVNAHAGGICDELRNPADVSSCKDGQEIFELASDLPRGTVDAIVAGHTHRGVAHYVNGIPVIEQFAHGQFFGRIDLAVGVDTGKVSTSRIFSPQQVCTERKAEVCKPFPTYEGEPVEVPEKLQKIADRWADKAAELREEELGVVAATEIPRSRVLESVMGNWVADLMLAARSGDVAITNGGGLRANIEAGPITYGELYRVLPFDNRFAIVRATGAELEAAVVANLEHDGGILSFSGLRVSAACKGGKLDVEMHRPDGKLVADAEVLRVVTSDFLATTGKEFVGKGKTTIDDEPTIRDAVADVLRKRQGTVSAADNQLLDPANPRFRYPGPRPVSCKKE